MESILTGLIVVLFACTFTLSFYFMFVYGYYVFISLFGYRNLKKDYDVIEDETRFLILVAAHNEEIVISKTLENLRKMNYRKSLFDICVVSDNSTDNTTQIAKNHGVLVVDTIQGKFEREGVGKPAGIQYALKEFGFENLKNNYDLIMVLDADNFVDPNILQEVNSQYIAKDKPEAIQTYLDTKNFGTLMSLGYSVVFWTNNRFLQLAKYRLGLPNSIGGTGFFIRTDWLIDNGGFKFKSLTEDLEMEIEIIKKGGRILWNDFTSIYDEKPEKTKIGMIQRHRWIKGHWYVAFKEIMPLLYKFVSTLQMTYLDKILFLMTMGKALHIFLILILLTVIGVMTAIFSGLEYLVEATSLYSVLSLINEYFLYIYGFNLLLILYSFGFLPVYSTYQRMGKHNFIKIFIALQWYMITDLLVQFIGLFTWHRQGIWVRTPHEKEELEVDQKILAMPETVDETINNMGEGLVNKQEKIPKV